TADGGGVLTGTGQQKYEDGKPVYKDSRPVWVDPSLRLWDIAAGKEEKKEMPGPVYSVAASPDGKTVFSGAYEPRGRRWEVGPQGLTPVEKGELKGSSGYPAGLTFSPDGTRLVTRYLDGRLILWDAANGRRLREWTTIPEQIAHVAFAPDGRHLAVSL